MPRSGTPSRGDAERMNDDADLVARVRRGDRQAFDDLYNRYADDVFSMCLLILGDPTVARAAAGTAFALVARTRLNPLSDPTRLRPWLLELARGSALAWSGSPQARSVPVPHGVSPEELLDGAVVPAPASLRAGLERTFDRAAVAAEAAAAAASRRAAERAGSEFAGTEPAGVAFAGVDDLAAAAGLAAGGVPGHPGAAAPSRPAVPAFTASAFPTQDRRGPAPVADGRPTGGYAPEDAVTVISPSTGQLRTQRQDDQHEQTMAPAGAGAQDRYGNVLPLIPVDRAYPGDAAGSGGFADFRARPAIAVAAALVVAVAGLTAVISWPAGEAALVADGGPGIVAIAPSAPPGPLPTIARPPVASEAPSPTVVPTVAGAYTSRPGVSRPGQVVREVDTGQRGADQPAAPPAPAPSTPPPPTTNAPAPPATTPPTTPPATPGPTTPPPATTAPPATGTPTTPPDGEAPTTPPPATTSEPAPPPSTAPAPAPPTSEAPAPATTAPGPAGDQRLPSGAQDLQSPVPV
ncbi:RNA polymerase subunit sigma [Parafrankia soli]|uniref:RNA polymerase subunit sigma n=2 Tax=Parafrankia soli TaxID=2599596 RepID=A0A1S1Q165_9ACTN|nr:RNA polymerase subunit sigma [Parafrankia soli]